MTSLKKKKILLIGWDAADWNVIMPLIDSGKMPALKKIVENGVIGNIATLDPPLSPMLWTSIATGKRADKHGILGFVEPDANHGGIRNVNSTSRKTRAIWNILHHEGYRVNVVGWWPSHPVEPINGCMVSNFFQRASNKNGQAWKIPPNSVHPASLVKELAYLRVHPAEITEQHILPFIPRAKEIDQKEFNTLEALSKILADTATVHSTATYLMDKQEWDFTAIYFDGIDHFGHGFMKYRAPKMPVVDQQSFEILKDVVDGGYIFHDMILEKYLSMIDEDTYVIITSDHGFHSGIQRPQILPKINSAPAMEHNPMGMVCFYGPGIKKDDRVNGATLLDLTPTILAILGLEIGKDMDGKVLTNIFENPPQVKYCESWDLLDGDFGEHPPHMKENPQESVEALQQLIELGYIEDPGPDKAKAMEKVINENQYNLSRVYSNIREIDKSIEILQALFKTNEADIRYNMDLVNAFLMKGDSANARKHLDLLKSLPEDDEYKKFVNIKLLEVRLLISDNKLFAAETLMTEMLQKKSFSIGTLKEAGKLFYNIGKFNDSINAFMRILAIDPGNASSYYGLARNFLMTGEYEKAADAALSSIGIYYNQPNAHYCIGESLFHLGMYTESAQALELTVNMEPRFLKARMRLVEIYENHIKTNEEKLKEHKKYLEDFMKGEIYIVSGLPRSGTSLMMQMISAGGIDVLSDEIRKADNNNPKGYYEYEKVKQLRNDNTWLHEAQGKVVKIISQLLHFIPNNYEYKIIFMRRDMHEILKSQQIMLGKDPNVFPITIASVFEKELLKVQDWVKQQPNVKIKYVDYSAVIENPVGISEEINQFFGMQLDVSKMIEVIDPALYRNKAEN